MVHDTTKLTQSFLLVVSLHDVFYFIHLNNKTNHKLYIRYWWCLRYRQSRTRSHGHGNTVTRIINEKYYPGRHGGCLGYIRTHRRGDTQRQILHTRNGDRLCHLLPIQRILTPRRRIMCRSLLLGLWIGHWDRGGRRYTGRRCAIGHVGFVEENGFYR